MAQIPDFTVELEELTRGAGRDDRSRLANPVAWSAVALLAAAAVNARWPDVAPPYELLLWTPVIIPAFLLVYRWGRWGAIAAVAAGTAVLTGVELLLRGDTGLSIRWWTVGTMAVVLLLVATGSALVVENLRKRASEAVRMAFLDAVTGLPNRRVLDLFLTNAVARARRGVELSVIALDLDRFRRVNGAHGREAGDRVLRELGEILARTTRSADIAGRMGSDYFLVILVGERSVGAFYCAERVRREFHKASFTNEMRLTVSCGIASYDPAMQKPRELLEAADRALRAAKQRGGDIVVLNDAGWARETPETASVFYLNDAGELREATPQSSADTATD